MRNVILLLSVLALATCSGTEEGPAPIPIEQYCMALMDATCGGLMVTCECGMVTEVSCQSAVASICPPDGLELTAAVNSGRIQYDGAAAARLMEKLRASDADCEKGILEDWVANDFLTAAGAFIGTRDAGATCNFPSVPGFPNDCLNGACSFSQRICIGAAYEGEVCDAAHECFDRDAPFPAYMNCDHATPGAQTTCIPYAQAGDPCTASSQCITTVCNLGECALLPAQNGFGLPCAADNDCISNYCDDDTCGRAVCGDYAPR